MVSNSLKSFLVGRRNTWQQQGEAYLCHWKMTHQAQTVGWYPRGTTDGTALCEAGGKAR